MKIYTIRDIARLSGVSVTTVSRVLNHRPDVNPQTREKVEQVMAECHFVGNANARSLKQADTETIALILRGRENPFLNSLAEAMLQYTHGLTPAFLTEFIDEKADEFQTAVQLWHEKRVKGFIFVGSRIDERAQVLEGMDLPMVFATVNADKTALPRAACVSIDDRRMGYEAMRDAAERGASENRRFRRQHAIRATTPSRSVTRALWQPCRRQACRLRISASSRRAFRSRALTTPTRAFFATQSDTTAVFCHVRHRRNGRHPRSDGHGAARSGGRGRHRL